LIPVAVALTLTLIACGCASTEPRAPDPRRSVAFEPWPEAGRDALVVRTDNYRIHTTIDDRDLLATLAQVMEGALAQYRQFTPGVRVSARPMECFVFATRPEWARFTAERTGEDATVYLKINKGGYTIRDWYVAYFIGDVGTYAVAAHEGWHQYVARHFRSRLPPFLEEGIATMFETIAWSNGRPRWTLSVNPTRAEKLRRAIERNDLWPLESLITMHAGDVVHLPGERIETFYAQNWAFAQFLWEAEDRRYRPALQRMLSDLAAGNDTPGTGARNTSSLLWNPHSARPLLEHYLAMPLAEIERAYLAYVSRIARQRHTHDT
jgi:hypothetical protein